MPSPENEPDRYSMKWVFNPNPPKLPSLKEIEAGEKLVLHNAPVWSIAQRLEYDKKMAAARSPGPVYSYDTNVYKRKPQEYFHYRGERTWFNKPKKGNGEKSMGLGPNEIGVVDQKHPLIKREPTATLNNFNPRTDDKTVANLPIGQDPGRYPPDAKDCAMNAPPKWTMGPRIEYAVGMPAPGRTSRVPVRNLCKMGERGGVLSEPQYSLKFRIDYTTQAQRKFPGPDHYQAPDLDKMGSKRTAPKFGFGTARRFPKPRFPEPRQAK
mmetsp:Transcript_24723/g.62142  ORF Transcript_24723/g.62142 Transcript_24723/m.62142 type:complete len:267 (+) Transcript_24723:144-944(+)